MDILEIREWVKFFLIVTGALIALRSYFQVQLQRRLENGLRMLDLFKENIDENDIHEWSTVFINSSEPSGAKPGHFHSKRSNYQIRFEDLFSEGPEDQGATSRIVEQIELIAYEAIKGTIDLRIVYSSIGQLIEVTYDWLGGSNGSLISMHYPNFEKMYRMNKKNFKKWPRKTISYIE